MQEAEHETSLPNELKAALFGLQHSSRSNICNQVCPGGGLMTSILVQLRDTLLNPIMPVAKRPLHDLERLQNEAATSGRPLSSDWLDMLECE
mmetsp:Transcript_132287/g.215421  ORF Transcript_132287/g.215421 Transcript_132287/m.215421 type:complete len:92 (-) Transcript_132287:56-331(-)